MQNNRFGGLSYWLYILACGLVLVMFPEIFLSKNPTANELIGIRVTGILISIAMIITIYFTRKNK